MQRWALLLTLLAAFSGTPLRQLEAAGDMARSFASAPLVHDVDAPDGGVGDEPEEGTFAVLDGPEAAPDLALDSCLPPPTATLVTDPAAQEGLRERVWWPQSPPSLRFAWLQAFRF